MNMRRLLLHQSLARHFIQVHGFYSQCRLPTLHGQREWFTLRLLWDDIPTQVIDWTNNWRLMINMKICIITTHLQLMHVCVLFITICLVYAPPVAQQRKPVSTNWAETHTRQASSARHFCIKRSVSKCQETTSKQFGFQKNGARTWSRQLPLSSWKGCVWIIHW